MLDALMSHVGIGLLCCYNSSDVLQEIDAALSTLAALPLFMVARGALIAQCSVAAPTKPCDIACFGAALRTLHVPILPRMSAPRATATRSLRSHG